MLIYEILLDEGIKNGEVIQENLTTLNKLAQFQRTLYPDNPMAVPKLKPIKHTFPDDLDEIDAINREISKPDDIKRGKGW